MLEAELAHLFECGGESSGVEGCERALLAGGGCRGAACVGRIEVGYAVGVRLRLAEDGAGLVLEDGVVEAHLREQVVTPSALLVYATHHPRRRTTRNGARENAATRLIKSSSRCTNSRW